MSAAILFMLGAILMQLFCMDLRWRSGKGERVELFPWAHIGWLCIAMAVFYGVNP